MSGLICKTCGKDHSENSGNCLGLFGKAEWNGEGLPPVGCECEFFNDNYDCRDSVPENGTIVKIVAHQKSKSGIDVAVFTWHGDSCAVHAEVCSEYLFRPIRTEVERRRDNAIAAMRNFATNYNNTAVINAIEKVYESIAAGKIPGIRLTDDAGD